MLKRKSFYLNSQGQKPIILLHGWGAQKEKLLPLGKALERDHWQVLIPDLPGFGQSELPPKPWRVGEYANFVLKLVEEIFPNKKVWIFGHSFGGRLAIKLASLYPDKIAGIILCGSAGISRGNPVKRAVFLILAKIGRLVFPTARFRQLLYKLAREHDYEKASGVMKETFKKVISEDLKPLLSQLKVPVLVLWGTEDKMTKYSDALIISSKIRQAKLVSFPGVGHRLPYEGPELLAEKISQWERTK